MRKSWQNIEDQVRDMASIIWHKSALPETIDGVNFDAVVHKEDDEIILIEVTEQHKLDKIREDISKILAIKLSFAIKGVFVKAYIVLKNEPTAGMVDLGKANKIKVMSVTSFSKEVFEYAKYISLRAKNTFGSSINPTTGESDPHEYIPVSYVDETGRKKFSIEDISKKLIKGEKIILLGDYGTGKSRCVRETFNLLSTSVNNCSAFTFAINLREHWGAGTAIEIIAGHLQGLGMSNSIDRTMQLLQSGHIILLLDGFDEVGSQTFGISQDRRATIRREALQGIRELISLNSSGVIVTGRPHYFNGNKEMLDSLGLSLRSHGTMIMKCEDQFSEDQAQEYLRRIEINSKAPQWLPKKPLIFMILAEIDKVEAEQILASDSGEIGFWGQFIDAVCEREARIHKSIDPVYVRLVLENLARITRLSNRELGRLTPKDVNQAYEDATGYAPDESGQLMLGRLCTLGRIEPESPDRQFVDPYIVQLLFAECLAEDISNKDSNVLDVEWKQALEPMGLYSLAQWIELYSLSSDVYSMIHRKTSPKNGQVIGELVAMLTFIENGDIDFDGLQVKDADICNISFGIVNIKNIIFKECIFGVVSLDQCLVESDSNVKIINSMISHITSLSSIERLPHWIIDCKVENTESISNSSRIKSSNFPPAQKLFLSIVQKIFFQTGGGRKESSLYKGGFGQDFDRKLIDKILNILVTDGYVEKSKDSAGYIYNPKREYTSKMKAIKDQLSLSKDPLWLKIKLLN